MNINKKILSPREKEAEVKVLLKKGYENNEIAEAMGISKRTVEAYFHKLYIKYRVSSKLKLLKELELL